MTLSTKYYAIVALTLLAACAAPNGVDHYDPFETSNRSIHELNKSLDTIALRPASQVYGNLGPKPLRIGVNNFASNLSIPGTVVNDLLQLRLDDAVHNTARFLVNSTVGLAGLFDPASELGVEPRPSDFGETLHVWGFEEGAFVELPFFGPSTTRDTVGLIVDVALNPVGGWLGDGNRWIQPAASFAATLDDRFTFAGTVDSVLYESADSYIQSRLFFLENRRFELGDGAETDEELYESYEDVFR